MTNKKCNFDCVCHIGGAEHCSNCQVTPDYDPIQAIIDQQIKFWSGGLNKTEEDTQYCNQNLSSWKALNELRLKRPPSRLDEYDKEKYGQAWLDGYNYRKDQDQEVIQLHLGDQLH